jgi:hypothetical protein
MGEKCSNNFGNEKCVRNFWTERRKSGWEINIKMDITETEY